MPTESPRPPSATLAAVALASLLAGAVVVGAAWLALGPAGAPATPPPPAVGEAGASREAPSPAEGWAPWDRNDDGRPVRWDPCRPVELVIAPDGAYPGFAGDLRDAVAEIEELTGLELVVAGEVAEEPGASRRAYQPQRYGDRWAPVLVAFAEPGEHGLPFIDVDRGMGAPVAVGPPGDRTYVTGQLVLNAERDDLRAGDDDRATAWGATIRHELGHVLGLAHVDDEDELMHVHPGEGPVEWGEGDRRGLERLGAGGCRPPEDPRPVDVDLGELR